MNVPISTDHCPDEYPNLLKERINILRNEDGPIHEKVTLPNIFKDLSCPYGVLIKMTETEDLMYNIRFNRYIEYFKVLVIMICILNIILLNI